MRILCTGALRLWHNHEFTTKGGYRAFDANLLLNVNPKLGGTTVTLRNAITSAKTPTEHPR